jgi:hypothetical protein
MLRGLLTSLAGVTVAAALFSAPASSASLPVEWDGLSKVPSKALDAVYLSPGADFRTYTKVIIEPPELALRKNWMRDYNNDQRDPSARITKKDVEKAFADAKTGFEKIFTEEYTAAGYQVVTESGPDVLRLSTAVINIEVNAPDKMTAGRSRSYSREAGGATLVLEARDSVSNTLLGRAVDSRDVGYGVPFRRTSVSNKADFDMLFRSWAKSGAKGLGTLKAASPIGGAPTAAAPAPAPAGN